MLLFTDYERAWDGERLSDIFKLKMNEPVAMITKFMRKHMKELDWQADDVRDKQAGHSSHTAGLRYGLE